MKIVINTGRDCGSTWLRKVYFIENKRNLHEVSRQIKQIFGPQVLFLVLAMAPPTQAQVSPIFHLCSNLSLWPKVVLKNKN